MKRRRLRTKSANYYRKNPLSDVELVVGGLVAAAVVGIGGYFVYNYYQSQGVASSNAGLVAANAASGQAPLPGGTGAPTATQIATGAAANQIAMQGAQGILPAPTASTG
jgi:hypothetical protein